MRLFGTGARGHDIESALTTSSRAWSARVAALFKRPRIGDELWDELEEALLGADLGVAATFEILDRLRSSSRQFEDADEALAVLRSEIVNMLSLSDSAHDPFQQFLPSGGERPIVVLVVGINGVGKTTTIAKLAHLYRSAGADVILGAGDTYRAAAIEQLESWGSVLGVRVVAHESGADPGAVAFDAIEAGKARGADVAIIDTAGRMHTRSNLMEELKKIRRVTERAGAGRILVLMVMDAATGQNALSQARSFVDAVGCDGVALAKLDGSSKGGVAIAIATELELPVLFVGTGEGVEDLAPFDAKAFADALLPGS